MYYLEITMISQERSGTRLFNKYFRMNHQYFSSKKNKPDYVLSCSDLSNTYVAIVEFESISNNDEK